MAKFIWKELSEDDPIFNGGFVISSPRSVPQSRKSKPVSQSVTDGKEALDAAVDIEPTQK